MYFACYWVLSWKSVEYMQWKTYHLLLHIHNFNTTFKPDIKQNRGKIHSLKNVVCYRKDKAAGTQFLPSPCEFQQVRFFRYEFPCIVKCEILVLFNNHIEHHDVWWYFWWCMVVPHERSRNVTKNHQNISKFQVFDINCHNNFGTWVISDNHIELDDV